MLFGAPDRAITPTGYKIMAPHMLAIIESGKQIGVKYPWQKPLAYASLPVTPKRVLKNAAIRIFTATTYKLLVGALIAHHAQFDQPKIKMSSFDAQPNSQLNKPHCFCMFMYAKV